VIQGRLCLISFLFVAAMAGCSEQQAEGISLPDDDLAALRSEVRSLLKPGCGSCHTASLPTAKPAAVAVFDFLKDDWSSGMTVSQLKGLSSRSSGFAEGPRSKVDLLVSAEMARRPTGDHKED